VVAEIIEAFASVGVLMGHNYVCYIRQDLSLRIIAFLHVADALKIDLLEDTVLYVHLERFTDVDLDVLLNVFE
jgi:hypothetical protein